MRIRYLLVPREVEVGITPNLTNDRGVLEIEHRLKKSRW